MIKFSTEKRLSKVVLLTAFLGKETERQSRRQRSIQTEEEEGTFLTSVSEIEKYLFFWAIVERMNVLTSAISFGTHENT